MIVRDYPALQVSGKSIPEHFHYTDIRAMDRAGLPLGFIVNELIQVYALWGSSILPKYHDYFAADIERS
jgi:hypothetical protein